MRSCIIRKTIRWIMLFEDILSRKFPVKCLPHATHLKIRYPGISSTDAPSWNELQKLYHMTVHQDSNPNNGHQTTCPIRHRTGIYLFILSSGELMWYGNISGASFIDRDSLNSSWLRRRRGIYIRINYWIWLSGCVFTSVAIYSRHHWSYTGK